MADAVTTTVDVTSGGDVPIPTTPSSLDDPGAIDAFFASLPAETATETPAGATPAATVATEAPAEGEKPAAEQAAKETPVEEAPAVNAEETRAMKMIRTANRKTEKALQLVPQARAETERALIQEFQDDPVAFLRRAGTTVQDFLVTVTGKGLASDKPIDPAERVTALEKRLEDERVQRELDQGESEITTLRNRIQQQVIAAKDKFPRTVRSEGGLALVTSAMESYFVKHKAKLPWDRAAASVEKYLAKLAGDDTASTPSKVNPATSQKPATTMTNQGSGGGAAVTNDDGPMDPDERTEWALRRMANAN